MLKIIAVGISKGLSGRELGLYVFSKPRKELER